MQTSMRHEIYHQTALSQQFDLSPLLFWMHFKREAQDLLGYRFVGEPHPHITAGVNKNPA